MKSTALGAENIIFISDAHEKFYYEKLQEVRYQDVYHKALCYCLGINGDTRKNADRIYNFKTGSVKTKCLHEGWQTSGSLKVVRIHQRFNPDLQIEGILFTMDSSHYNNSKRNKQAVRDAYRAEIIIFDQTIPRTEALAETASEGVSIFSYDAKGKGAYSYQALVQEVLNHA